MSSARPTLVYLVVLVLAAAALIAFLAFGPPRLYSMSESPQFCGSCHVLQPEYEAWFHSGAHLDIKCIDCHLPNNNLPDHLFWKSVDGVKDFLAFHTGLFSEPIHLSDHGAAVVVQNCRRCHGEVVSRINENRRCWDCHRRVSHKRTGSLATWNP